MLSVAEAQALVLEQAHPLSPVTVPLGIEALGRVLAEDIASDLDVPPYDKALMDGYAVRTADLPDGQGILSVVEEIMAGQCPTRALGKGQCSRIMTGAVLPDGADAVIMVERTRTLDGGRVAIEDRPVQPGTNILRRANEMRRGEKVLTAGAVLRPQEMGLLATVGRAQVRVFPGGSVAIVATGDELVEPDQVPGPGQIRNSNGPMLVAQTVRAGATPHYLGIASDQVEHLRSLVRAGLEHHVLILSGGVSMGQRDLVPGVLQELGVRPHFHKVAMKPGKPVFFGTCEHTLVFGLPGNPVSSLICFELFVRPALRRLQGHADVGPPIIRARLTRDYAYRTDRPTYHPARLEAGAEGWTVDPVAWLGSTNLRGLVAANAFLLLPSGELKHRAGELYPVLRTDGEEEARWKRA